MSKVAISGNASGTGTLTIAAPNTNSNYTLNLPAETGTLITTASTFAGTGPAFSAYPNSATSCTANTYTKVTLDVEIFDTNSNFASSRFTPTVAGYYQISGGVGVASTPTTIYVVIYKNGSALHGQYTTATTIQVSVSALVYLNGSTDYVELYTAFGATQNTYANQTQTFFTGAMVRSA